MGKTDRLSCLTVTAVGALGRNYEPKSTSRLDWTGREKGVKLTVSTTGTFIVVLSNLLNNQLGAHHGFISKLG